MEDTPIQFGPQESFATAVEARFVNTLITRRGKPDYVPLTTNLGLRYKAECSAFRWILAS